MLRRKCARSGCPGCTPDTRVRTEQGTLDVVFAQTGRLTRVDIARRTGLPKTTVNAAVEHLEREDSWPQRERTGHQGRVATFY
ncbi:winged helix-turn-helix domain-containing protein [Amycolatopsis sp. NBC_00355]|uniref:winged helix-turn-helix domain-containing protein n=1 Tax=Amycolatopsis sp. NBC_00355 TaxID=2975957 RepID=UPI003FA4CEF6